MRRIERSNDEARAEARSCDSKSSSEPSEVESVLAKRRGECGFEKDGQYGVVL
jgi:hypothetical protein